MAQLGEVVGRPSGEHWAGRLYARRISIHMARLEGREGRMPEAVTSIDVKSLAGCRRLARVFPVHRTLPAVEASILILGAAVIDLFAESFTATRVLTIALAGLAWLIAALHLVSILNSSRLTADGSP